MTAASAKLGAQAARGCAVTEWRSPRAIVEASKAALGGVIDLDPATSPDNPCGAYAFCTGSPLDGLVEPWGIEDRPSRVYVNPPYGKALRLWVEKIGREANLGCQILALLPANRLETGYLQDGLLTDRLDAVVLFRRRLAFLDAAGEPVKNNTFGSMLYAFGVAPSTIKAHFGSMGAVLAVRRA